MAQVFVRENESLESALKRFKRSCARDGVMAEVRKREHYEKPSVKRKKKSEAARKKARKYECHRRICDTGDDPVSFHVCIHTAGRSFVFVRCGLVRRMSRVRRTFAADGPIIKQLRLCELSAVWSFFFV